jgi:hypothetical protein
VLTGPVARVVEPSLLDAEAGPQGRDRADLGEEPRNVQFLGLVKQVDRAVQVATRLTEPGCGDVPAVPVLDQRRRLPQRLGC